MTEADRLQSGPNLEKDTFSAMEGRAKMPGDSFRRKRPPRYDLQSDCFMLLIYKRIRHCL